MRTIEVDEATATALESRAAEKGVSLADLLAQLAASATEEVAADPQELAELDRRWAAVAAGAPTVAHDRVVDWLESWGSPHFRPWQQR